MIDLTQFDLDGLSMLWAPSEGNPQAREAIEKELAKHIAKNERTSREYIFEVNVIKNHALGVNFIPSSVAFKKYGANVAVDLLLSDAEKAEMINNYKAKKNTSGRVKAKVPLPENYDLDENQLKEMSEVGFHTRDILSTEYYGA